MNYFKTLQDGFMDKRKLTPDEKEAICRLDTDAFEKAQNTESRGNYKAGLNNLKKLMDSYYRKRDMVGLKRELERMSNKENTAPTVRFVINHLFKKIFPNAGFDASYYYFSGLFEYLIAEEKKEVLIVSDVDKYEDLCKTYYEDSVSPGDELKKLDEQIRETAGDSANPINDLYRKCKRILRTPDVHELVEFRREVADILGKRNRGQGIKEHCRKIFWTSDHLIRSRKEGYLIRFYVDGLRSYKTTKKR